MIIEQLQQLAVDIKSIKIDPDNARVGHDIGSISKSLELYGQRKPVVVNRKTGEIEAGNGTYQAAVQLGWSEIAVVFVDDDRRTHIGYAIADNRLTDKSKFDAPKLAELFKDVEPLDIPGIDAEFLSCVSIEAIPDNNEDIKDVEPKKNICPRCSFEF